MKTEKRPTEGAYQLRARNKLSQQQRHDSPTGRHRRQQARWSGNGIGATNDSTDYKPLIRIVDGLPVEYTCTDDPRVRDNGTSVSFDLVDLRVLIIQFDYEMATEPGADFDSNLRYLEWSVLWNVAQSIGLHNCNFQAQEALFGERRLQQQPSSPESFVVGLSSLDGDEVDTDTGKKRQCRRENTS